MPVRKRLREPKHVRHPPPPPRADRCLVTVDVGEDCLFMLDELVARVQKLQIGPRRITRSAIVREAILCLYSKQLKPEK